MLTIAKMALASALMVSAAALAKEASTAKTPAQDAQSTDSRCGDKRSCKDMSSCSEARYYLQQCGAKNLDRDGDGIPCESLCKPKR